MRLLGHIPKRLVANEALPRRLSPPSSTCGAASYGTCLRPRADRYAAPARDGAAQLSGRSWSWLGISRLKVKEESLFLQDCGSDSSWKTGRCNENAVGSRQTY